MPEINMSVTILDVAREAGVSYSTVSRVLSGYEFVKDSTRQRVLEAVERLGYVVNQQARSLAGGKSGVIGLLVPGLDNSYIAEIARGIDEVLSKASYDLLLYTTHRTSTETSYALKMTKGLADGLLLVVPLLTTAYVETLREQNFPYVLIDQVDPSNRSSVVDSLNRQGAYEGTQYLLSLGHRRIGFITGLMKLRSAEDRLSGYLAALRDAGIPVEQDLIQRGDFWRKEGYEAAERLLSLSNPPTAIFASNDLSAFGAMEAIRAYGLQIPQDISIMGFDDIPQASLVYPRLTTVRQPLDEMGRIAAQLLVEQIENPDRPIHHVTLPTSLVVRESCQPPRHP
ncbi:MAG: LacI family DNA-binding transcriptional regulator [Chloroflexi bacterium]|nr:LacI family DNA-binding transcriptional regulator [Chloroflexota bacterium]